jgi:hypothetical protein
MDEAYINDESGIKRRPEDQAGTLQQTEMRSVTIKPQQKLVSRKKRKSSCGAQDCLRHKTSSSFVSIDENIRSMINLAIPEGLLCFLYALGLVERALFYDEQ